MKLARFLLILSSFSIIATSVISCDNSSDDFTDKLGRSYDSYSQYFLTPSTFYEEFYTRDENYYYVYMYGTDCPHCELIKGAVFDYLESSTQSEVPIYLFDRVSNDAFRTYFKPRPNNYSEIVDQLVNEMIGATSVSETYFIYVPSLYVIRNNTLIRYYYGRTQVGSYLKASI